ncbi:MAG: hypothetical protein ACI4DU_11335 [Lachnospiraceae bacterium]
MDKKQLMLLLGSAGTIILLTVVLSFSSFRQKGVISFLETSGGFVRDIFCFGDMVEGSKPSDRDTQNPDDSANEPPVDITEPEEDIDSEQIASDLLEVSGGVDAPSEWGLDGYDPAYAYLAENPGYHLETQTLVLEEGMYSFDLEYPYIVFDDGRNCEEMNQIIRDKALIKFDSMYPIFQYSLENPSYCASTLRYEITYMDENLLCVAFYEHYFSGNIFLEFGDITSVVLNVKTGEVYNLEDVIAADNNMARYLYGITVDGNPDFQDAPAYTVYDAATILVDGISQNRYKYDLLLLREGIGFAFTYHYGGDGLILRGSELYLLDPQIYSDYKLPSTLWDYYEEQ